MIWPGIGESREPNLDKSCDHTVAKTMNDDQLLRYSRHIMLPELDIEGQEKLLAAHALVIGMGGLGAPLALYLAAAGVGKLTIVDHDSVEASNLQRQIIHSSKDVGRSKVASAKASLAEINPDCVVTSVEQRIEGAELEALVSMADIVLDGTDNFATRYAINAACVASNTPLVSGAAIRWEGQVAVFDFRDASAPCYACLHPDVDATQDLSCADNGVAAPVVGIIGSMQALEALKLLTSVGESLSGHVLVMDAKFQQWQKLKLSRSKNCAVCAER